MSAIEGNSQSSGGQYIGSRERQEDSWLLVPEFFVQDKKYIFAIVCDGMGGHEGGALASRVVVDAFHQAIQNTPHRHPQAILTSALDAAKAELTRAVGYAGGNAEMGTTLVAVLVDGRNLWHVSVGDSLLLVASARGVVRHNADHSMKPVIMDMAARGEISPQDADNHPQNHMLRSVLMPMEEPKLVDMPAEPYHLENDSVVVLGSDGIETLEPHALSHILFASRKNMPAAILQAIASIKAQGKPNQDNATLIGIFVEGEAQKPKSMAALSKPVFVKLRPQQRAFKQVVAVLLCLVIVWLAAATWRYNQNSLKSSVQPSDQAPLAVEPMPVPSERQAVPSIQPQSQSETKQTAPILKKPALSPSTKAAPKSERIVPKFEASTPQPDRPGSANAEPAPATQLRPRIEADEPAALPAQPDIKLSIDLARPCKSDKEERAKDDNGKIRLLNGKELCVSAAASLSVDKP